MFTSPGPRLQAFTATPGAYQGQLAAGTRPSGAGVQIGRGPRPDAFVMKLGTSGEVAWATYLGGSGPDEAHAIAIDNAGNVWVTGETVSPDFPVTGNVLQRTFHGEIDTGPLHYGDAFVSKLDSTGGKLLFSTYLGGSAPDGAFGIAIDISGSAYVAGVTESSDFPTTSGTLQPNYAGERNARPSLIGPPLWRSSIPQGRSSIRRLSGAQASVQQPLPWIRPARYL